MKIHFSRVLLVSLILLARLPAGEWSHWSGVRGDLHADRSASVVIRSRRDEGGDQPNLGYRFVYELHNQSGTLAAKVSMAFPTLDPATRQWEEPDLSHPSIVHDIPPMGTVTGSRYAPSERGMTFESGIKWPEEGMADSKPAAKESAPKEAAAGTGGNSYRGVPLTDKKGLLDKLSEDPEETRYRAILVFATDPADTGKTHDSEYTETDEKVTWREHMEAKFLAIATIPAPEYRSKVSIIKASATEITVAYESGSPPHVIFDIEHAVKVLELAQVTPTAEKKAAEKTPSPNP
jgi:hypothetical protein